VNAVLSELQLLGTKSAHKALVNWSSANDDVEIELSVFWRQIVGKDN
jgi:hypothetical protein